MGSNPVVCIDARWYWPQKASTILVSS